MSARQLLGRAEEMALLGRLLERDGRSDEVLLVTGEPGIGKSALLFETGALALSLGFRVLTTSGVESETHLPFGGLHQLMTPLMGGLDSIQPTLRDALSTALGLFDGPRPDICLIAQAALQLLVQDRREHRVLVLADDVQWLDPQSHQIITFLAHRAAATDLVVVGTVRSGHGGPFVDAGFPRLEVVGVDEDTAAAILAAQARDLTPADRKRVQHESRGNPLALLELPGAWGVVPAIDGQPPALSRRLEQAFAGRISQLPARTKDALLVAATDSSTDLHEILAATGTFALDDPTADVLSPAVDAGLVMVTEARTLTFRHPLVRSGILQTESVARRQLAHRALSKVLAGEAFRSTWHRAQSIIGPDDQIADELEATVAESLGRGAVMSAVWSLERAAALTSSSFGRGRRLLKAAGHAFEIGHAHVVARLIQEAAQTQLTELDEVRLDLLRESLNDDVRADPGRVMELCAGARTALVDGDIDLSLDVVTAAALRCWWADVGTQARGAVVDVLASLRTFASDDPRHLCALALAEPVAGGAEVMTRLLTVRLDAITDGDSLRTFGMAAYAIGDYALATDILKRAEQLLREKGQLGLLTVVLALQFHIRLDLGDWTGSAAASEEVDRVAVETGQALFAFNNVLVQARGLALRGEWQSALELVVGAEGEATRLRLNDALCLSYQSKGAALLSADRPVEAFEYLRRQFDPADPGFHLRESFAGVALMAEAALDCGRTAEAREVVATLEEVARATPAPLLQVNLLFARAILAPPDLGESHFRAAMEADLDRWPWIRARLRLEYSRSLCDVGRLDEAIAPLRQAGDVFATMGAARWIRRAASTADRIASARVRWGTDSLQAGDCPPLSDGCKLTVHRQAGQRS